MSIAKRTEMRAPRSADPVWWVVTGLLSAAALSLPKLLQFRSDRLTDYILIGLALFFIGALVGSIRRDRAWRWAVAAFLAFLLNDILQLPSLETFSSLTYVQLAAKLAGDVPGYLLQAAPVLAGAYIGGGVSKAGVR